MLAWRYYSPENLKLEEIDRPSPNENEVLIKNLYAITGGTDTKTFLRGHPKIIKSIPSLFGYEYLGEVAESKNQKFKEGDIVVGANTAPCFICKFCKQNKFELCENLEFLMGSFAEYLVIPQNIADHNLHIIQSKNNLKNLVMTQTLAVCLLGFERSAIVNGQSLALIGSGPIAQCFVKLAKKFVPQSPITLIAANETRINLALKNGVNQIINYKKDKTNQKFDRVIEAAGTLESWQQALSIVESGGQVNFFGGLPKGTRIELDSYDLHYKEITITGSFHHNPDSILKAKNLLENNEINLCDLISHEMQLQELDHALDLMIKGEAMKVLLSI
ncbi:MAG: zinc-binding dehydrogenase [Candidatus Caenarcaniphilales bacterium]|jgi:L-iditol 2-dehydrogenase|nr:zinc-binding dehydrogenase [Candidatus Caenarcaniphilales bacterium]